jgi:hypothetical protein
MLAKKNNYPVARRQRIAHCQWLIHIERCEFAKLSHEDYCRQNHLSLKSFKKHFCRNARQKMLPTSSIESFVPVVVSPSLAREVAHYAVEFPCGVLLNIPVSVSLSNTIKLLKGLL